jgi:hypothetical protein
MATPYVISSDLVSAYPAKSLEIAQYIDGFKADLALVQNAQTGTTYTFVAADFTKLVTASNAAASTYTVPPQSSVTWPANTLLRVTNLGAGVVTFAGGVGVTVTNTAATLAQYQTATLVRTGSDAWTVIRQGAAAPGMDLITPTSVAGSGVTLSGGAVSFSSSLSISVNGCFTTTYDNYRIVISAAAASAFGIYLRFRTSGTDNSAASYQHQYLSAAGAGVVAGRTTGDTKAQFGTIAVKNSIQEMLVSSPALSARTLAVLNSAHKADGPDIEIWGAGFDATTTFDGFTIYGLSSSITGTLRIYGLRNS